MKRRTGKQADSMFNSTEGKKRPSETFKTPETAGKDKTKGGRPPKDRPQMKRYTVILTPDQWEYLRLHAAAIVAQGGDADRSAIVRNLIDQLQAGGIKTFLE